MRPNKLSTETKLTFFKTLNQFSSTLGFLGITLYFRSQFSSAKNEKIKGVLYQQGIKEHVCDILEGGNEAFKQRERKYAIK